MMKSIGRSALYSSLPGTLYSEVEPCDVKSVTARLSAATSAVPAGLTAADTTSVAVLAKRKLVVPGTAVMTCVPLKVASTPATTTVSPIAKPQVS